MASAVWCLPTDHAAHHRSIVSSQNSTFMPWPLLKRPSGASLVIQRQPENSTTHRPKRPNFAVTSDSCYCDRFVLLRRSLNLVQKNPRHRALHKIGIRGDTASRVWTLTRWSGILVCVKGNTNQRRERAAVRQKVLRIEFSTYLNSLMLIPAQMVHGAR